ncbi:hypothetical protein, partial [uncultured Akkermansia sp.]|uniref:hypothetical protein n=1 Tax=uncultured Akkermansia sp. TaxID=512294 RepID=UPI00266CD765
DDGFFGRSFTDFDVEPNEWKMRACVCQKAGLVTKVKDWKSFQLPCRVVCFFLFPSRYCSWYLCRSWDGKVLSILSGCGKMNSSVHGMFLGGAV